MTISGERTEQVDIFCCVTGFTSDFSQFLDVELIRFFHGALQLFGICLVVTVGRMKGHLALGYAGMIGQQLRVFPFNALTLLVWQQKWHPACGKS